MFVRVQLEVIAEEQRMDRLASHMAAEAEPLGTNADPFECLICMDDVSRVS